MFESLLRIERRRKISRYLFLSRSVADTVSVDVSDFLDVLESDSVEIHVELEDWVSLLD